MGIFRPGGGGGGLTAPVELVDLEALTASRALVSDGSGVITVSTVTNTELEYLSGVSSAIQTQINGKASSSHTHAASDVTSGVFNIARLATGTPDGTKFVRDDGTLATPTSSSGITIGTTTITGGATTQVLYNTGGVVDSDSTFVFDDTNKCLGLGTTAHANWKQNVSGGSTQGGIQVATSSGSFSGISIQHTGDGSSCGALTATAADNGTWAGSFTQSGAVTNVTIGCVIASMTSTSATGSAIYANHSGNADTGQCIYLNRSTNGTTTAGEVMHISNTSSGTPAAGFGGSILWQLKSSTTADQDAVKIIAQWRVATHNARSAEIVFQTVENTGALATVLTVGNGYVNMAQNGGYQILGTQVMGARSTGWTVMTGTPNKGTFATYTAPTIAADLSELSTADAQALVDALQFALQRLKAYDDAFFNHGSIGT